MPSARKTCRWSACLLINWGQCYVHYFMLFSAILGENLVFFLKTNVTIIFFCIIAVIRVKIAKFFSKFCGEVFLNHNIYPWWQTLNRMLRPINLSILPTYMHHFSTFLPTKQLLFFLFDMTRKKHFLFYKAVITSICFSPRSEGCKSGAKVSLKQDHLRCRERGG
jgi:hypothetical protein